MADDPEPDAPSSLSPSFKRARRPFLAGASCGLAATLALSAGAQPADPQALGAAQAVFDDAGRLMAAKRYDEACPKLEEVIRLVPSGVGAKLQLAKCYDEAGRLASAWGAYVIAANDARTAGQAERVKAALDRAAELKPRLASLKITVPTSLRTAAGLEITRDGVLVTEAQWGVAVPADSGAHTIRASAPGREAFQTSAQITGEGTTVEIALPDALKVLPAASAIPSPAPSPTPPPVLDPTSRADTKPGPGSGSAVPVWAWVAGGAGVLLAGASIGFLVDQTATQAAIDEACPGGKTCVKGFDASGENARLYRDFGLFVGLGAAALAGLGAGVFGIVTAPKRAASAGVPKPWISTQGGGLSWEGRF